MSYEYKEELPTKTMERYKEKFALLGKIFLFTGNQGSGVVLSCLYFFALVILEKESWLTNMFTKYKLIYLQTSSRQMIYFLVYCDF